MSNDKKASLRIVAHAPTNEIPFNLIVADHSQNVRHVDVTSEDYDAKVKHLAKSIKRDGLLENLVVVPAEEPGRYRLVSGFRRYEAIKRVLKWSTVPCKILPLEGEAAVLLAAGAENDQREDMTTYDRAVLAARLSQEFGMSGAQIATSLSKGKGYMNNLIRSGREIMPSILEEWKYGNPVLTMPNIVALAGIPRHDSEGKGSKAVFTLKTGKALKEAETAQKALFDALVKHKGDIKKARAETQIVAKPSTKPGKGGDAGESGDAGEGANGSASQKPAKKRLSRGDMENLQEAINVAANAGKLAKVDLQDLVNAVIDLDLGNVEKIDVKGFTFDPTFKPAPPKEDKKDNGKSASA